MKKKFTRGDLLVGLIHNCTLQMRLWESWKGSVFSLRVSLEVDLCFCGRCLWRFILVHYSLRRSVITPPTTRWQRGFFSAALQLAVSSFFFFFFNFLCVAQTQQQSEWSIFYVAWRWLALSISRVYRRYSKLSLYPNSKQRRKSSSGKLEDEKQQIYQSHFLRSASTWCAVTC